jgi:hypothetical protein
MTDQSARPPGYRGSLPPRVDRLAPIWVAAVVGILVLVFVLALAGIPSRFIPEPTPLPIPSTSPAPSVSGEPEPSPSEEPEPSPS